MKIITKIKMEKYEIEIEVAGNRKNRTHDEGLPSKFFKSKLTNSYRLKEKFLVILRKMSRSF